MNRIIDSHHNLWDPCSRQYPWIVSALEPINRPFGMKYLRPELAANGVVSTIRVQTVSSQSEKVGFLDIAAGAIEVAGVVGWVDLSAVDVASTIQWFLDSVAGTKLVGIRHQVHDDPYPSWLLNANSQRGIGAVGDAGLVYELLVRPRELPAALETVLSHRSMHFVIDHLGKPNIGSGEIDT